VVRHNKWGRREGIKGTRGFGVGDWGS